MPATSFDRVKTETMDRFTDKGPDHINCAQAMVDFAMGVLGRDRDAITIARYLGGGVSGMGGTCGAVTGTGLAFGLRDQHEGRSDSDAITATQTSLKELIRDFEQEFGACSCRELTGHDIRTPEGMQTFRKSEASQQCPLYISWMCDRLLPMLVDDLPTADAASTAGDNA